MCRFQKIFTKPSKEPKWKSVVLDEITALEKNGTWMGASGFLQ